MLSTKAKDKLVLIYRIFLVCHVGLNSIDCCLLLKLTTPSPWGPTVSQMQVMLFWSELTRDQLFSFYLIGLSIIKSL